MEYWSALGHEYMQIKVAFDRLEICKQIVVMSNFSCGNHLVTMT